MTTQEKIDIIKFYDEGREIEIRCKDSDNAWSKYDNNLCGDFDFKAFEYRINPRKFKVGDVVISKKQEGKMLYQHTMETIDDIRIDFYIVNGGSHLSFENEDRFIKINELLWYFESLGQDGYWKKTNIRMSFLEAKKEFENDESVLRYEPIYAMGFRLKQQ